REDAGLVGAAGATARQDQGGVAAVDGGRGDARLGGDRQGSASYPNPRSRTRSRAGLDLTAEDRRGGRPAPAFSRRARRPTSPPRAGGSAPPSARSAPRRRRGPPPRPHAASRTRRTTTPTPRAPSRPRRGSR